MTQLQESITIEVLDTESESLTQMIEEAEKLIWIEDDKDKVSDDIRIAFYKIQSLDLKWDDTGSLKAEYDKLLERYWEFKLVDIDSEQEYITATTDLLNWLNSLKLPDWRVMWETLIDWDLIDVVVAMWEWLRKAKDKIVAEIEETLSMFLSRDELQAVLGAFIWALSNPIEFATNLMEYIKTEFYSVYRNWKAIMKAHTDSWSFVSMNQFVPEQCIPVIVSALWPGKFKKFLDILRMGDKIPWKILDILDDVDIKKLKWDDREKFWKSLEGLPISQDWQAIINRIWDRWWRKEFIEREFRIIEQYWDDSGLRETIIDLRWRWGKLVQSDYSAQQLAFDLECYVAKYKKKYEDKKEVEKKKRKGESESSEKVDKRQSLLDQDYQRRNELLKDNPETISSNYFVDVLHKLHSEWRWNIDFMKKEGLRELDYFERCRTIRKDKLWFEDAVLNIIDGRFVNHLRSMVKSHMIKPTMTKDAIDKIDGILNQLTEPRHFKSFIEWL